MLSNLVPLCVRIQYTTCDHLLRVSFHVDHSPIRFQILVGGRCLHVNKHKLPTNHILVAYQNVEGGGHMPLDIHAPTTTLFNLQLPITEGLKTCFKRKRRLIVGPKFKKMRVVTVADTYKPYPARFHLHLSGVVLISTRIWWESGLHRNSPLGPLHTRD